MRRGAAGRRAFLKWALGAGAVLLTHSDPARAAGCWWSSLVWGVFENRAFNQVAPLRSHRRLAREGTVLARYYAVSHPSGPNYRAMASGEIWGTAEVIDQFHPSLASAAAHAEPPIPTYIYHLRGQTAARHNPLVDLHAPIARTRRGLEAFRDDLGGRLPETCLVYVGWSDDDDLHNGDFARADRSLTELLDMLAASPWFTARDHAGRYPALFFTYDEDDFKGDNRVFAAWWGRGVRRGHVSQVHHTHYGFCRTVTENWGLPALGRAAHEDPIEEPWG